MKKLIIGNQLENFKFNTSTENSVDFFDYTNEKKTIISFLRYNGCPICKMEMATYKKDYPLLKGKNVQLFVVLQSSSERIEKNTKNIEFPFTIICDPKGVIFDLFGVEANLLKFLHPIGLFAAVKATFKGHMHGKFEGKETQMPATFIIDEKKNIILTYYGKYTSDVPNIPSLLNLL